MIASGLHSGLAIKRQRKRRMEQIRARERRYSTRSNESGMSSLGSPRGSIDGGRHRKKRDAGSGASFESNVGIGMLHIGVVFLVLGGFLLASGLIPDDFDKFEWEYFIKLSTWWNELVVTGAFSILLGVFLIILDKFISGREEADLEEYVSRQLTRSKSGHILIRDIETGNLTTKRSKSSNLTPDEFGKRTVEDIPEIHRTTKSPPPILDHHHQPQIFSNGDALLSPQLEQILEEDPMSERGMGHHAEGYGSTTASLSTVSPSETQELLMDAPYAPSVPRAETTINMMGAMPAVAVRLERRKAEKRLKRPSQLYLSGYNLRQTTSPNRTSPSPSPLLSPPRDLEDPFLPEIYVCGKISALHLAVVSLLLGAVILIVGLVQLKPGADAPGHRYYLIAIGCALEVLGLLITTARCILLHWKLERRRKVRKVARSSTSQQGDPTVITTGNEHLEDKEQPLTIDLKHLYNSSDVMYIDDSDTGGRAKSPGESIATIDVLLERKMEARPVAHPPDTCSLALVSPTELDTLLTIPDQGGGT